MDYIENIIKCTTSQNAVSQEWNCKRKHNQVHSNEATLNLFIIFSIKNVGVDSKKCLS